MENIEGLAIESHVGNLDLSVDEVTYLIDAITIYKHYLIETQQEATNSKLQFWKLYGKLSGIKYNIKVFPEDDDKVLSPTNTQGTQDASNISHLTRTRKPPRQDRQKLRKYPSSRDQMD